MLKRRVHFLFNCMLTLISAAAIPFSVSAQKNTVMSDPDSIQLLKKLAVIFKDYKKQPVQVNMQYSVSTNYVTNPSDTMSMKGSFFLSGTNAYLSFGDTEQILSDSVSVLVNNSSKRLLVFSESRKLMSQMKKFSDLGLPDSNQAAILDQYFVNKSQGVNGLILESRSRLYPGGLANNQMNIIYDKESKQPAEVIMVNRLLIPIEEMMPGSLTQSKYPRDIVLIGNREFMIKNKTIHYVFETIKHDSNTVMPVKISDRVVRSEEGKFVGSPGYEMYSVKEQN